MTQVWLSIGVKNGSVFLFAGAALATVASSEAAQAAESFMVIVNSEYHSRQLQCHVSTMQLALGA